jgi:hypothetical protein
MRTKIFVLSVLLSLLVGLNSVLAEEQVGELVQVNETPPAERCEPNLGDICSNLEDCKSCYSYTAFCLWCPEDTVMKIQVDADPYYAELTNKTTFVTKNGGEQGYCGYGHTTKCIGNWNGDEYYIDYYFLRDRDCVSDQCVGPEEKLPLVKFLTKDMLDAWKNEILKTISENYFNQHLDIESIHGYIQIDQDGNHKFEARIYYKFKYDWATTSEAGHGDSWDRFVVAEKRNGVWGKLTENEMSSYYQQELERWHNLGKIKATEQEISSIISEQEVLSKLKSCNNDMEIDTITIGSENKTIYFMADGKVDINTANCAISHENKYNVVLAGVNLITGEFTCTSHEAPCAIYAPKDDGGRQPITGQNLILYVGIGIFIIVLIIVFVLIKRRK